MPKQLPNVECYCLCGATARGVVAPASQAGEFASSFWRGHQGYGHGPTDRETAARAYRAWTKGSEMFWYCGNCQDAVKLNTRGRCSRCNSDAIGAISEGERCASPCE